MKLRLLLILVLALAFASPAYASEVTGTLTTGVQTGVEGTVIVAPTASPAAGTYTSAQSVTLTASGSSSVRYTADGSTPSCSVGTVYSSAISVGSSLTLKAIACYPSNNSSPVTSSAYTINISAGGGGGGGGGAISPITSTSTTTSTSATTTPALSQGQVLGATIFNFTKDLHLGSTGADVTELQKLLIAEGFDIPAITKGGAAYGTFGGQTLAAVIAYQKAHGISPAAGYVGSLTRAVLNKGATGAPVATGKSNLSTSQANAIIALLESFGADAAIIAKVKASLGL